MLSSGVHIHYIDKCCHKYYSINFSTAEETANTKLSSDLQLKAE